MCRGVLQASGVWLTRVSSILPGPFSLFFLYGVVASTRVMLILLLPHHYIEYSYGSVGGHFEPPTSGLALLPWVWLGDLFDVGHKMF
jgi:hypothetical protein